jgi:hypothetical protein
MRRSSLGGWGQNSENLSRRSRNTSCLHPCCELRRPGTRSRSIAAQEWVIAPILLQEQDGKEFSVAYISQHLLDAKTRYVFVEKHCLSLYYACSKFRHYILFSSCIVACQYDVIKHMLLKPILSGRMGKWAYALVEYDLAYEPLRSMKGQVVADFIADHAVDVGHSVDCVQLKPWGLYFDGSVCSKGQGARCDYFP